MKPSLGLIAAALLTLCVACGDDDGGGGSGGSGGGGADRDTVCGQICTSIEALNCSGDGTNCMGDCAATWDGTLCQAETQALLACSGMQPASAWECDEFDEAALNQGCDSEGTAVTTCILDSL